MNLSQLAQKINDYLFIHLIKSGVFNAWDDERYLTMLYKRQYGVKPDFEHPQTFSEKLNWLKLHDRKPAYTRMADKYEAKKIVAEKVGGQYVVPAYGVWDSAEEIDFDALPDQFVLKTTHDCGGMLICHDKAAFDREAAKRFLSRRLKRNYYFLYREWPYKEIKPRIFAERYLVPSGSSWEDERLLDYKFFCFNGVPKIMYISADKDSSSPIDFFDMAFNRLDLRLDSPRFDVPPEKPAAFEEMQSLAAKLSAGIPHIRVDFYFCGGNVYVGELTFFHSAGFERIHPSAWNDTLGSWIDLRGVLT